MLTLAAKAIRAGRMLAKERLVGVAVFEEVAVDRQRDRDVCSRLHWKMKVRRPRERRLPRIDHHERGAALLGLAHVRDEMNAGGRRVDTPEHDQRRLGIVLVGHRRHLAVERLVRGAGRRRARTRQP
jgi:hypothetical protein